MEDTNINGYPGCILKSFKDVEEEKLYAAYNGRQRQRAVPRLLATAVLLQLFVALVPGERSLTFAYGSVLIGLAVNFLLWLLYLFVRRARSVISHLSWLAAWAQLLVTVSRRIDDTYNELLGWALILQYFTFATFPFNLIMLIIYSIISFLGYMTLQYYLAKTTEGGIPEDFKQQQQVNALLLIGMSFLGCIAFIFTDFLQRKSFQVTKKSLRDKLIIEQQSKEQERLLLSVLPEHVAVQMRQDIDQIDTQFKKIYMSRHENVSILYADIVGFTAISSTYSAQDLVAILNELFARFDRLAEKYQQLRIKILGDCYYCISGAPVERPDHAVLCVHMGLSMVKAIKYVQQITNSPVDMRVGIHTGAVLAGVLGQRQWQFDVYSRDVELANKMESSGMAGRVHISEVTLGYLNDEFEVEPAHGEKREDMLRQAGIKTYFIVRVLKPWQGSGEEKCGDCEGTDVDAMFDLKDDDEDSVLSPQDEKGDENAKILSMLQEELVNRDDDKELADSTTFCLTFKDHAVEETYAKRLDNYKLSVAPTIAMLPAVAILTSFAVPPTLTIEVTFVALTVEAGLVNIIYYIYFRYVQRQEKTISPFWKISFGLFNSTIFVVANVIPLIVCGDFEASLIDGLPDTALSHAGARRCAHPSYYYHLAAGAALGTLWISPMTGEARSALLAFIAALHALPAIFQPAILHALRRDPYFTPYNVTTDYDEDVYTTLSHIHAGRNILMIFFIVIVLLIFNRYTDALERARHSRGMRMRVQAEQAAELCTVNQALVHNVLPPHVASHFMGAKHHHRDLYSQSYAEVGVLFASMPNFSEFYSEETVNNQGLECLRFLNEVISDFDLLLENSQFCKDIIKIKTISSTYMAASGLNPTREMQPKDGVLVRWAHLERLVEFALELQRVLTAINEQSFNHFVLRMGINHGPITAGVIGARKPHYDIWGNTVNVASRMESTGKAGCIQVTEETCRILEHFGYFFEQRGLVAVKGKGKLMTYYLQGKRSDYERTPAIDEMAGTDEHEVVLMNGEAGGGGGDVGHPAPDCDVEAGRPLLTTPL